MRPPPLALRLQVLLSRGLCGRASRQGARSGSRRASVARRRGSGSACGRPPLPLRHDHEPRGPEAAALVEGRRDREVHDQLAVDGPDIVRGGEHLPDLQIVMRLKGRPVTSVCLPNLEVEAGSLKAPPVERSRCRVEGPVGLDPLKDIVVRRQEHRLSVGPAPCLLKRKGAELRDLAVDHRGELVDDHALGGIGDDAAEHRAEPSPFESTG